MNLITPKTPHILYVQCTHLNIAHYLSALFSSICCFHFHLILMEDIRVVVVVCGGQLPACKNICSLHTNIFFGFGNRFHETLKNEMIHIFISMLYVFLTVCSKIYMLVFKLRLRLRQLVQYFFQNFKSI